MTHGSLDQGKVRGKSYLLYCMKDGYWVRSASLSRLPTQYRCKVISSHIFAASSKRQGWDRPRGEMIVRNRHPYNPLTDRLSHSVHNPSRLQEHRH
jgi:hypothetical protein